LLWHKDLDAAACPRRPKSLWHKGLRQFVFLHKKRGVR
jgi:hypothetical protein